MGSAAGAVRRTNAIPTALLPHHCARTKKRPRDHERQAARPELRLCLAPIA